MRLALIDYGAGNLASVRKGFAAVGAEVATPAAPGEVAAFDGIVLPGVGHFRVTASLDGAWREAILRRVDAGVPLLGICLGMQMLFEGSDEAPEVPGLGLVTGRCERIAAVRPLKVPHVGWNSLSIGANDSRILREIGDGACMYFTHAYAAPVTNESMATVTHGTRFAAVVARGNVTGVQFHPEKSGAAGLRVLRNFLTMAGS